jgi:hypothetical protein
MDFLDFANDSFLPNWSIGELCEDLNTIVGQGICYDTFQIQNTKWLWLVNDIVTTINSDNVRCATFGLYPSYVAGILNSVKEINFYVLCDKHINYAKYIKKCIAGKECTFKLLTKHNFKLVRTINFQLSSGCDTVEISFRSKTNTWTAPVRTNIRPKCVKKNAFIVSTLRCCVYQETFNIYHELRVNIKTWEQIWCIYFGFR